MRARAVEGSKTVQSDLLKHVHEIGSDVVRPNAVGVDRDARFPTESFEALKKAQLLSALVPKELGGLGLSVTEVSRLCEALGQYCASTAMVFAMHQIQVACIVRHAVSSDYFRRYLKDLVSHQYLLASATTEIGTGGDLGTSVCALVRSGERFTLEKQAPVISYALNADAILVTCRRSPEAPGSDQLHVLIPRDDCQFDPISGWDTLGFRGTCSSGYRIKVEGHMDQVIPAPFSEVLSQSMHPVAHLTWGSLWLGLASDAVNKARDSVRKAARKDPAGTSVAALRLTEVDEVLFSMRAGLYSAMAEYEQLLAANDKDAFSKFGFAIRINNVKLRSSEMVVDIVGRALTIIGISGYRNDSDSSLCRHLRDAYGAALMVNNDRIRGHNSTMQLGLRS